MKNTGHEATGTGWWPWVEDLIGRDDYSTAARRAGFDKSTMSRWRSGGKPDIDRAFMLATAYGASRVEALGAMGILEPADLTRPERPSIDVIRSAKAEALADELVSRIHELQCLLAEQG